MPIQAVHARVKFSSHEPFRERWFPGADFLPRFEPGQVLRRLAPELVRVLERRLVHLLIFLEAVDARRLGEFGRRLENAVFLQGRFNIHGRFGG